MASQKMQEHKTGGHDMKHTFEKKRGGGKGKRSMKRGMRKGR